MAALKFPVPFWPYGQWAAIGFLLFVIAVLAVVADTRVALVVGLVWLALLTVAYRVFVARRPAAQEDEPEPVPLA